MKTQAFRPHLYASSGTLNSIPLPSPDNSFDIPIALTTLLAFEDFEEKAGMLSSSW